MRVLDVKDNTEEKNSGKWKGYITASIAVPLDKTWHIGSDFSGLHKFVPIVEVCERLKGRNRTPGCLRFYTMNSASGLPGGKRKAWARDRLLNIEEKTHSYTYAVEGSNMNLENCQITFKAIDGKDGTTIVTWAWEVDPIKKSTKEKTLSDMSDFGCTFIKGLEAAVATTDSIDFNFEGAPLDIDTRTDGDGGVPYDLPVRALSLMKSRLDTLTQTLNKISQTLEDGSIPAALYQNELESLQSTLADGRRSLVNHLHGYISNTCAGQSNESFGTSDIAERYEEFEDCPLLSEPIVSKNDKSIGTCKNAKGYEDYYLLSSKKMISPQTDSDAWTRKRVDAVTCLPDNGKGRSRNVESQPCPANFSKLASEEALRVEMDNASGSAYEAFQDFSNQFQGDLRDDISHQLKSVGIRLEALGFHMQEAMVAGLKDGTLNIHPNTETQGGNYALGAGPREGHETAQTPMQEISHDARWPSSPSSNVAKWPSSPSSNGAHWPPSPSSNDAKMAPSPRFQTLDDDRGQFGVWELDALRNQRLQGSPHGMHSVRFRSRLLFQDLLQKEMSQDSEQRSHETKIPPKTLQLTNSVQEIRLMKGCSPCCQTPWLGDQKSPPSQSPKRETHVPSECHFPQSSELGKFTKSSPMLEGSCPQDFASSKESGQGSQQLQNSQQDWKHRESKMRQASQNLEADRSLQITANKMLEGSTSESGDEEFHRQNVLPRLSRLPPDIWPDFPHGESGGERHLAKKGQVEDISNKGRMEDIYKKGKGEDNSDIVREPTSSSPSQTLENYRKILEYKSKSLPPRFPPSLEPVHQMMARSSVLSLDNIPFKLGSEGATSSPVSGISPSGPLNPLDCPLSAAYSFGQCSKHVMLDLRNEIAPGVFHCRQGNQTRVVVDVPDGVEAREEIRRHMGPLHRKDEIYKEFKLIGIQKPPTEEGILEDFAATRFQKQQEFQALFEIETPANNDSPVFLPYYADGKVWNPDVGPSLAVDKSRFEQGHAYSLDPTSFSRFNAGHLTDNHPTEAKSPSGQNARQSPQTKYLSRKSASKKQSPNQILERIQSEQQVNMTNSFQKDGSGMTSEVLRAGSTAQELALSDSNRVTTSWGGFNGRQGYQPRVQTAEGYTNRHGYPPVPKREILIKGHGQRAPHVQPTSSNAKKKTQTGVSTLTESSSHVTTTSSGDNACPGHKSVGSGDSFAQLERVDEIRVYPQPQLLKRRDTPAITASTLEFHNLAVPPQSSSKCSMAKTLSNLPQDAENTIMPEVMRNGPSSRQLSLDEVVNNMSSESGSSGFDPFRASGKLGCITGSGSNTTGSPEIRVYSQAQLLKINTPVITTNSTLESRQSVVSPQSLQSSSDFSMANILSNIPQDAEDFLLLEMMRGKRSSPQLSLDEVVNNAPSESGSSEFDPFRTSGKLGSITGSGSNTSSGHSFKGQLNCHVPHFTPSEKPTNLPAAQSNPLIYSLMYPDNLAEGQQGRSDAMESRPQEDCPFRQLKKKLDEVIQSSESSSPRHLDDRPHEIHVRVSWADSPCLGSSGSRGQGSGETSSSWRNLAFNAILDETPQASDDNSQRSDLNVILEEPGPRKFLLKSVSQGVERGDSQPIHSPISHELYRQVAERAKKIYCDAETQTNMPEEPEVIQKWSSQTSQTFQNPRTPKLEGLKTRQSTQMVGSMANVAEFMEAQNSYSQMLQQPGVTQKQDSQTSRIPKLLGVEGLRTHQSTQKLDSMANVAQFMDAQNSYSQMLDDVVGQTVESISSFKARKRREADELAFRTRQSAQMLNSMLNVREYTDDSRSYSAWLDGVAPLSVIQTPMNDSELQTPWNESESGAPREPRFREDSAANFLGSVAMQILQEFGDSKKTEADAQDYSDSSFQEDSAAFLGALSKQIVKEYTDYTNDRSQPEGQSEGPSEPRFREQSALNFLAALSEHVFPEFMNRRSSLVIGVPGGGEPRFRENSAINFLSALREQVLQRNGQNSISELPGSSDLFQSIPPRYLEAREASKDQAYFAEGLNYQLDADNQVYPIERVSSQIEIKNQASPTEGLNYHPESDGQVSADEGLSYRPASSKGQVYLDEGFQLESNGQRTPGENLRSQPDTKGQGYLGDDLTYQPKSERQGTLRKSLSLQPISEGREYQDKSVTYEPESNGQSFSSDGLRDHPDLEGQACPDEGLRFQPESDGEGTPGENLSYQLASEGSAYLDEGSSYEPEEGQSFQSDGLSDPEGKAYPDEGLSFQPESEGQGSPGENLGYQPASDGQAYLDEGLSYEPTTEGQSSPGDQPDQGLWDKGLSFEPESEGQGSPDENLGDQPNPEGQAYPNEGWNDQPEGEPCPDEGLNDQLNPEGEDQGLWDKGVSFEPESEGPGTLDENLIDQPDPEDEAYPDEGFDDQQEGDAYADEGLNDQPDLEGEAYANEGRNDQPDAEGQASPDESFNEQPEDETSESESGTTDQESQNQLQYSRNSQFQDGPRNSQRSSQVAQLNEMLQDLHTTVSRSRKNSASNQGK